MPTEKQLYSDKPYQLIINFDVTNLFSIIWWDICTTSPLFTFLDPTFNLVSYFSMLTQSYTCLPTAVGSSCSRCSFNNESRHTYLLRVETENCSSSWKVRCFAPFRLGRLRKIIWAVVWGDAISILILVGQADWTYGSSPMKSKIKLLNVYDGDF